jgi:hypothetical protein
MPRAVECILDGRRIGVEHALELRDARRDRVNEPVDFRCIECDMKVRPHKKSLYGGAHFEHIRRNPKCKLSDPER